MATHLGLGQGLRVMRDELTRSSLGNLRKESLVDVVISLAFTTRSIPGVRDHLQAAHKLACTSPAHGGGMEAALRQLSEIVGIDPVPALTPPSDNADSEASTEESGGDKALATDGGPEAIATESSSASKSRPLCRSLWKGKVCEDPQNCDRAHKPFCSKEGCKSARDSTCTDWHYGPKKKRLHQIGSASSTSSKYLGNGSRGRSAPESKSAKNKQAKSMSQETQKMYLKWKLSEMKLEQSELAAATYRDILVSKPTMPVRHPRLEGQAALATSVHAPQQEVLKSVAPAVLSPSATLGPILSQLETIMAALKAAGMINN